MQNDQIEEVNKKLEVVIALLLKMVPAENNGLSMRDQIALLDNLKIRPVEIAEIIGRNPSYVNKELVGIRKNRKGK